jgi:hypothetical protein
MSADTTQGTGLGAAKTTRGPDGGKNSLYQTLSGPHVVAAGVKKMASNQWKVDVLFPEALGKSSDYSVSVVPQISVGTDSLNQQGSHYYDYGVGGNFRVRINKLDNRWTYDPNKGTDGSWYVTEASLALEPTHFIGFTVHIGTDNNDMPRPEILWTVTKNGFLTNS